MQTDGRVVEPCSRSTAAPEDEKPNRRTRWVPVTPVPSDAEHPPKAHLVRGVPQAQWCYRDESGQVLGYVYRFITSDGSKEVLPLSWCRHEVTGKCAWRWISFATRARSTVWIAWPIALMQRFWSPRARNAAMRLRKLCQTWSAYRGPVGVRRWTGRTGPSWPAVRWCFGRTATRRRTSIRRSCFRRILSRDGRP